MPSKLGKAARLWSHFMTTSRRFKWNLPRSAMGQRRMGSRSTGCSPWELSSMKYLNTALKSESFGCDCASVFWSLDRSIVKGNHLCIIIFTSLIQPHYALPSPTINKLNDPRDWLDVLDGYNGTVFAYGQTGSGKTFTMMVCPHLRSDTRKR